MKKISTLYKKDPNDLSRLINEVDPENSWVIEWKGIATQKFDGTACAIINGELYKRYDCKINRKTGKRKLIPNGAIACQEPDEISGHHPHWIKCSESNPADKYHIEAYKHLMTGFSNRELDGTYELCGEKIQGNPEQIKGHILIKHGCEVLSITDFTFEGLKNYLSSPSVNMEGIVFHHLSDNRMCKIRKCDFGIIR